MTRRAIDPEAEEIFALLLAEVDQSRAAIKDGEGWSTGFGALRMAQAFTAALGEQTGLTGENLERAEKAILRAVLLGFGVGFRLGAGR